MTAYVDTFIDKNIIFTCEKFSENKDKILEVIENIYQFKVKRKPKFYVNYEKEFINDNEPYYSKENLKALEEINNKIMNFDVKGRGLQFPIEDKTFNYELGIKELNLNKTWKFDVIRSTNLIIHNNIDLIKSKNLSPYEKYLAVYLNVTNYVYKFANINQSILKASKLPFVLNGNKITCIAYSKLLNIYCNELGLNTINYNLLCDNNKLNGTIEEHVRNIIRLKDAKYGINGVYYADSTYDSVYKEEQNTTDRSFLYHAVPLSVKIDDEESAYLNKEKTLFDLVNLSEDKIKEEIRKNLLIDGVKSYNAIEKLLDKPLNNFEHLEKELIEGNDDDFNKMFKGLAIYKMVDENINRLKDLQLEINKTQNIDIKTFKKALNVVVKKMDTEYFPLQIAEGMSSNKITNKIIKYNLELAKGSVKIDPQLLNKLTFTDEKYLSGINKELN